MNRGEDSMSGNNDQDRTDLFTVVGAAYVPEHHTDSHSHYHGTSDARPPETGIAGLWLVFYVAIVGIAIFKHGGAGTAVYIASAALN
jgi:hypothetical protein